MEICTHDFVHWLGLKSCETQILMMWPSGQLLQICWYGPWHHFKYTANTKSSEFITVHFCYWPPCFFALNVRWKSVEVQESSLTPGLRCTCCSSRPADQRSPRSASSSTESSHQYFCSRTRFSLRVLYHSAVCFPFFTFSFLLSAVFVQQVSPRGLHL